MNLLQPDWPAPAHVRAVFSTRAGGVSNGPFDSLNLGDHVRDDAQAVTSNRALLRQAIGAQPVFLKQVHGWDVARIGAADVASDVTAGKAAGTSALVADACFTQARGVACTIMVADCLPVLFTDHAGSFVAAAHAGWRGLLGSERTAASTGTAAACHGVLEELTRVFRQFSDVDINKFAIKSGVNDILAWLGPCIGPQYFEVGDEVRAAFVAGQSGAAAHFQTMAKPAGQAPKFLANLPGLARDRLHALGISQIYGNDGSPPWCTVSQASQFFSHRRDAARLGSTGRMAACIWLA